MSLLEHVRDSLRGRLALSLLLGLVVVLSVVFFALHLLIRQEFYSHLDSAMLQRLQAVATYVADHPGKESIAEFMPQFRTREHEDFFQVWDGDGRTLARSDSSAGRDLPRLKTVIGIPTYQDLVLPDGHEGRAVAESIQLAQGDARRILHVVMAEETEAIETLEGRIHFILLGGAVAAVLALLVIARYSVLRGLMPLENFARSLERVDLDDPEARLETGPLPVELRPVATRFSALFSRLVSGLAREKRYARNVAHELRNPLAEMRLLADVGSRGANADTLRAALRDIGDSAAEMEQIVDSLMALTRYEAGLEAPEPEPVELCGQLRQQAGAMQVAAEQRALKFDMDLPHEFWIYTDSALVRRLVANLLGNAIAHSPRGSSVRMSLSPARELRISNPAPQLSAADVPRLGERFFRIGSGERGSHAGLGLSLASAIANVLGIGFRLELDQQGNLVARLDRFQNLAPPTGTSDRA